MCGNKPLIADCVNRPWSTEQLLQLSFQLSLLLGRPLSANLMNTSSEVYKAYMEALNANLTLEDLPLKDNIKVKIESITPYFKTKNKTAAIMSSHCGVSSKRLQVLELLNRVKNSTIVDIYGKCGELRCKTYVPGDPWCWKNVLSPTYFFYFSMENTFCDEYITEKLYFPLKYGLVPVVYGGE